MMFARPRVGIFGWFELRVFFARFMVIHGDLQGFVGEIL